MKTYSSKSNAKRAAKSQGLDLETINIVEQAAGQWAIEEAKVEAPQKKEAPVAYVDGPITAHKGGSKSTVERPCHLVWELAESMPGARRKDVIAAAVEKGVAFYTARTQYQQWLTVKRSSETPKK